MYELPGTNKLPGTNELSTSTTSAKFEFMEATDDLLAKQAQQLDGVGTSMLARCEPVVLTLKKNVKVDFYRAAQHRRKICISLASK